MRESATEWTDSIWNPGAGRSVLSLGCASCRATGAGMRHPKRRSGGGHRSRICDGVSAVGAR